VLPRGTDRIHGWWAIVPPIVRPRLGSEVVMNPEEVHHGIEMMRFRLCGLCF